MQVKSIKVGYAFIGNKPRHRAVDKKLQAFMSDGWQLQSRQEFPSTCLEMIFSLGWHRGHTLLTFYKSD